MFVVARRPAPAGVGRKVGVLLAALLLGGCATAGPSQLATSALPLGKGRIVMQRTNETLNATLPATAKVNGMKVAEVGAGETAVVDVAPGQVALSVEAWMYPGQFSLPLDVRPGEVVKVEIAPRESSGGVLGAIGGMMEKDENGNGGAFSVRQVANLDSAGPGGAPSSGQP